MNRHPKATWPPFEPVDGYRVHVVVENETLWDIARRYGFDSPSPILAVNSQIQMASDVHPGQEITIPRPEGKD